MYFVCFLLDTEGIKDGTVVSEFAPSFVIMAYSHTVALILPQWPLLYPPQN
jgi:hypothetical protein